jgi:hypothetical protein
MEGVNNCVDREMAMRLLKDGVFLSERVQPISRPEALVLLAETKLDRFVCEFKSIVRELLSGRQLSDFEATLEEMGRWLGASPCPAKEGRDATAEGSGQCDGREDDLTPSPSYSTMYREVDGA